MTDAPEFNWIDDDSIAVREQPAIAVYENTCGQVTLRRERAWNEEDDVFIPIARENVLTIIGAMLRAAGMDDVRLYRERPGGLCCDVEFPTSMEQPANLQIASKPKDRTATERQRRRRAKTRDNRDRNRDSVTVTPDAPLLLAAE
jgi:hypothetical protein